MGVQGAFNAVPNDCPAHRKITTDATGTIIFLIIAAVVKRKLISEVNCGNMKQRDEMKTSSISSLDHKNPQYFVVKNTSKQCLHGLCTSRLIW